MKLETSRGFRQMTRGRYPKRKGPEISVEARGSPSTEPAVREVIRASPTAAQPFAWTLPAVPSTVSAVRHALRELLDAEGADPDTALALLVAVGEAVTNAVEHAYRRTASGPVAVRAWTSRRRLIVEIRDQGQWQSAGTKGRGHGLRVASALVDRVDVTPSPRGTVVRVTTRLRPAALRPPRPATDANSGS